MGVVLGIDVSTTATKAVVLDATGAVLAIGSAAYGFEQPHPLWSEQDPGLWWDGAVDGDPPGARRGGRRRARRRRGRADRPDARTGPARCGGRGPAPGDPVERPADRRGVRRDPRDGRRGAPRRDHRQRRPDRVHGAQARLGAGARAGRLGEGRPRAAAQGLPALPPHRRVRARQGGRRRDAAVRPRGPRLVTGHARRPRHRPRLDAAHVRGSRGDGRGVGGGRRRDRPARRDAR